MKDALNRSLTYHDSRGPDHGSCANLHEHKCGSIPSTTSGHHVFVYLGGGDMGPPEGQGRAEPCTTCFQGPFSTVSFLRTAEFKGQGSEAPPAAGRYHPRGGPWLNFQTWSRTPSSRRGGQGP